MQEAEAGAAPRLGELEAHLVVEGAQLWHLEAELQRSVVADQGQVGLAVRPQGDLGEIAATVVAGWRAGTGGQGVAGDAGRRATVEARLVRR